MIGQFLRNSILHRPLQALAHLYIIQRWRLKGSPLPPPALFKQKLVKEYGRTYSLQTLVETGTAKGKMVRACLNHFQKIISIELDPFLFQVARQQFISYQQVTLLQGDSGERLAGVLATLAEPALFWLDAHAMIGGIRPPKVTPILDELDKVLTHHIKNHVILIDDARLFREDSAYPTIKQLEQFIYDKQASNQVKIEVLDDVIRVIPVH